MEFWSTAFGGFLAAALGLGGFFVQDWHRRRSDKRRLAMALLQEMLHAQKFLAAAHKVLTRISKKSGSVSGSEIRLTYPSHRKIYPVLGANIGVLSEKAVHAAVNFDHYMQGLERDFEYEVGHFNIASTFDPATALKLANKISSAINSTTEHLECMASEAYGGTVPEATKEIIRRLKIMVGINVSH